MENSVSPRNSKKRVFSGNSSFRMEKEGEEEVVEIPNPNFKSSKQKEVIDIDDVDDDDDLSDVMLIDERVGASSKGKEVMHASDFKNSYLTKKRLSGAARLVKNALSSSDGDLASGLHPRLPYSYLDKYMSDFCYDDDDYVDMFPDVLVDTNGYSVMQSHFDKMDIPPGVEAPIPWWLDPEKNSKKPAKLSNVTDSSESKLWQPSSSKVHSEDPSHLSEVALCNRIHSINPGVKPNAWWRTSPLGGLPDPVSHSHEADKSTRMAFSLPKNESGSVSNELKSRLKKRQIGPRLTLSKFHVKNDEVKPQPEPKLSSTSWWEEALQYDYLGSFEIDPVNFESGGTPAGSWAELTPSLNEHVSVPLVQDPVQEQNAGDSESSSSPLEISSVGDEEENLMKLQTFKSFDMVDYYSDHHYKGFNSSQKQPPKTWAKKIQEEWRILEKDLPDTIFVRVFESRMDLLRAVVIGAEGTPYQNGLFFFDVFFPAHYPSEPPQVHYNSFGLRLNPNLYNSGKVCLSLLNTWQGNKTEKWLPGMSTMLQVLVSIQALILNANPYFNEPGYEMSSGTKRGQQSSEDYNKDTFIKSLQTMLYTLKKPPLHFEDLVMGHFCKHAHDILSLCKAYMDGVSARRSYSFKEHLVWCINSLVQAFTQIGAKDCEKFRVSEQTGKKPPDYPQRPMHFQPMVGLSKAPNFPTPVNPLPMSWSSLQMQVQYNALPMQLPTTMYFPDPMMMHQEVLSHTTQSHSQPSMFPPPTMVPLGAAFPPTQHQSDQSMTSQPYAMPQSATSKGNSYKETPFW